MDPFLHRLDLNLLKSLHALLKERSVTKAAERMFVTQSAMSKSLRRLRESLNDPLLIQTSKGLMPTPYAQQLAVHLELVFETLETCLIPEQFDPEKYQGTLRIAAPEPFALGVVPGLIQRLHSQAPGLNIELIHLPDSYLEALAENSIDFVMYLEQDYSDDFTFHRMFSARPVIACKESHPLARKRRVTLQDLCNYPKLAFHSPNVPPLMLNEVLAKLEENDFGDKALEVLMTTSHFLVALRMLRASDAFMVSPDFVFREPIAGIKTHPIDHIELFDKLTSSVGLIQSRYTLNSPLHRWVIAEALNDACVETP